MLHFTQKVLITDNSSITRNYRQFCSNFIMQGLIICSYFEIKALDRANSLRFVAFCLKNLKCKTSKAWTYRKRTESGSSFVICRTSNQTFFFAWFEIIKLLKIQFACIFPLPFLSYFVINTLDNMFVTLEIAFFRKISYTEKISGPCHLSLSTIWNQGTRLSKHAMIFMQNLK